MQKTGVGTTCPSSASEVFGELSPRQATKTRHPGLDIYEPLILVALNFGVQAH